MLCEPERQEGGVTHIESGVHDLAQELIRCGPSHEGSDLAQKVISSRLRHLAERISPIARQNSKSLWVEFGEAGPLLVFAGHTDVVPAGEESSWSSPPFAGEIRDGKLYGRGAADMRGPVASFVVAIEDYVRAVRASGQTLPFRIGILLAGDEETAALDTDFVIKQLKKENIEIDACIVGEPTAATRVGDTIKIGRRGSLTGHAVVHGKQGHAAYPELATNPIHLALHSLQSLVDLKWERGEGIWPRTSVQLIELHAGVGAFNVIPGDLRFSFNIRYPASYSRNEVIKRCEDVIRANGVPIKVTWTGGALPYFTTDEQFIEFARESVARSTERSPELSCGGGTSDGRFFAAHGIPVVEVGPSARTIHQVDEHINCEELTELTNCYRALLSDFEKFACTLPR